MLLKAPKTFNREPRKTCCRNCLIAIYTGRTAMQTPHLSYLRLCCMDKVSRVPLEKNTYLVWHEKYPHYTTIMQCNDNGHNIIFSLYRICLWKLEVHKINNVLQRNCLTCNRLTHNLHKTQSTMQSPRLWYLGVAANKAEFTANPSIRGARSPVTAFMNDET